MPPLLALMVMVSACSLQPASPRAASPSAAPPQTVAERSDYRATSTSEEVRDYLRSLAARSSLVRVSSIGKTVEGRDIPLVIVGDPPPADVEAARKSGKLVVLAIGDIHAGEVDGKEALLALMRDVVESREAMKHGGEPEGPGQIGAILDHLALAFVPLYNADANDKMGKDTRPGQVGPELGQGVRENAAGLDLNRDFVKLEAPETRALVRFMRQWDPAVVIDTHTTNGSYHRYLLTYGGPKNPAGNAAIVDFATNTMLPGVGSRVKASAGFDTFFYGNFTRDHGTWEDYPDQPRYGAPYVGLRNRLSVLTESYSYATYRDRVRAQHAFVGETLRWVAERREEIKGLLKSADETSAHDPKATDMIAVRSSMTAFEKKVMVLGWEEKQDGGRAVPTDTPRDYEVEHRARFAATLTVTRPFAYIIPAGFEAVVENLQRHGIVVDELREGVEVDAEVYGINAVTRAVRAFQGHETVSVSATGRKESRAVEAGSFVVRTGQKLGPLACYLLEPQSDDGLTAWNFFDSALKVGGDFPVLRVPASTPLLTVEARSLPEDQEPPRVITFEDLQGRDGPNLSGNPAGGQEWMEDGEHYLQFRDGKLRRVEARSGRSEAAYDPEPAAKALATLATIGDRASRGLAARPSRWNESRTAFLVEHENDLYYVKADGSSAVRLTSTPEAEELVTFSPDGRFAAFVRGNDLWVVDVGTGTERALTTGGSDLLRNGKADWVYFEEVFGRNWRTYWWSPDSTRLAYMQVDSTPTPTYTIVNNSLPRQRVEQGPYPKAGEANPRVRLLTVSTAGGPPREVDLSAYDAGDLLLTRVAWRPDSSGVVATVTNRTQTWMDVLLSPAEGGTPTVLFRETTGAWVDDSPILQFFKDGSFLFASERTGWKHLYRYGADGKLVGAVTSGEWECRSIARLDEIAGVVYVVGTRDNPIGENLYRVALDGSGVTRLTTEAGSHRVTVAPRGNLFIDSWSSAEQPPKVALRSLEDGSLVRMLDTNPVRDLERYRLGESSRFQVPTPDGFPLEATLLKPPDFDPGRAYPVWFMTYGGPHSPTISDTWSGAGPARTWDQALASAGFLVYRSDPRSASGKGAVSAWACYKQLGVSELADIETAVRWLTEHPWADGSRVGMSGHSYGGFMAAYAMTRSTLFAAGIAGAPVTDWREYDSVYTERYMLTPQENPEGYRKSSVVEGAKNLHGRLLLLHGMLDDNVHMQNNTRLIRALQQADKPFEMMLYPDSRHGIGGRHYQRLQVEFILRTLGGGPRAIDGPGEGSVGR
jgi:dipeptidyl-peptidase-4